MTYQIIYTDRAVAEIREATQWWRDNRSTGQAARWINEIFPAIDTLREDPGRFPLAAEADLHPHGLRQLLFGVGRSITHRIIFTIAGNEVWILAVRHVARRGRRGGRRGHPPCPARSRSGGEQRRDLKAHRAISCFQIDPQRICISTAGVRANPGWVSGLIHRGYYIYCGFDADRPGDDAARRMIALHPTITRLRPPARDWNDALATNR